ncbi:hypothetical protein K7X08_024227 [Anisodus acutangulus]|uniref:Uncharacterized protein n=1 Tax=Anisodus acutangulus TaxID=402998 RepID=A0A9Q1M7G6_9SOLA|nr:hypothetical protein K7X08_024227 [Anisodus acutangulus]
MALRFNIDRITADTPDWTCKVQIVDMTHARESPEKKIRFLNLILKDEEEQQIRGVVYGDDIGRISRYLKGGYHLIVDGSIFPFERHCGSTSGAMIESHSPTFEHVTPAGCFR